MSCFCDKCKVPQTLPELNYPPSNKPVPHCNMNVLNSCSDSPVIFSQFSSPQTGVTYLNNLPNYTDDFVPTNCMGTIGYTSSDPRLIDPIRGTTLVLNEPPRDTGISSSQIYEPKNTQQSYSSYDQINFGQIRYRVNNDIAEPYYGPNFPEKKKTVGELVRDPMGGVTPVYVRETEYRNPCEEVDEFKYCLSFMEDTTAQRKDIMSRQMYGINKTRWEPRWMAK